MFKFSPPTMKVILSSGSFLTLVALGCLVVMSTSVHTSDIQNRSDELIGTAAPGTITITTTTTSPVSSNSDERQESRAQRETTEPRNQQASGGGGSRHRSARLYQSHTQQQQSPLESYAAAYAAANSGAGADQLALTQQQSVAVGSQSSDSSFGETPPPSGTISSGHGQSAPIARQLSTSPSDYPAAHASYYAGYMSPGSNEASFSGAVSGGYPSASQHHLHHLHQHHSLKAHHQQSSPVVGLPAGYPTNVVYEQRGFSPVSNSYYDRIAHSSAAASSPFWATSSLGTGGLMSSASHALSHWTNGFSIGEIVCGLVAIAIGAIILGAPFFLIYLALMGNFSGSGTLSLTNPTSATGAANGAATPANGRRKRLAVFEAMNIGEQASIKHPELAAMVDSVANSLGPYVNLQQVSSTFRQLVRSIEQYSSNTAPHEHPRQVERAKASRS